jgi:hypothetical protein
MTIADTLREEDKAASLRQELEQVIRAYKIEVARKMLARGQEWATITDYFGIRPEDLDIAAQS